MGLWAKSLRIFNSFCDNAQQSIREVAHQTGLSKSSVHRLKQAMERRETHPESGWWATAAGPCWFLRLVVATLSTFGRKRGVGPKRSASVSVVCALRHIGAVHPAPCEG